MSKYKMTILMAVFFTIPLLGYFIVNGYWWLYDGNTPDENKMLASISFGLIAFFINVGVWGEESYD